ncbi:MAG: S8 family serine peptidase [Bacteroidales bacterium]
MKTFSKSSIIAITLIVIGFTAQSQNRSSNAKSGQTIVREQVDTESLKARYAQGGITLKLKKGVGDYGKQTGTVRFGIQSLDDKTALFEVYQLDKLFRYNPAKLRPDLPDLSRIYKISFPEKYSVDEVVEAFSSDPNVEYAESIPIGHLAEIPNDSLYAMMQHLPQIWAPQAWNIHKGENGTEEIVIAINDTGVDWEHEDLMSNIWQNLAEDADNDGHTIEYNGTQWVLDPGDLNGLDDDGNDYTDDLVGWNFFTNTGDPNPIPGNPMLDHGTHCAGIAAGVTNNGTGIASISWNVKVMGICIDNNNTVPFAYDGIIYAAENGADIISNSWGGPGFNNAHQEAVSYAAGLGSIILGCAHNQNEPIAIYPASYQNVISVAAVSADDTKAPYSNYNLAVDISAPGGGMDPGILSTIVGNQYAYYQGTSMATPMVAGCLGLLKSYRPDWPNDQLITQVLGTADNIDSLNPNYINMLGTGRVNAYRMLTQENVLPFLKLELLSVNPADANGNSINEQGENVTLNFNLKNYAQGLDAENVIVSISADDPQISILSGSCTLTIPSDTTFAINNQFQIQVAADASPHVAQFTLHFETDSPVLMGQDMVFDVLVAPSGIFVFEGIENGRDYSGSYIGGFLDHLGYDYCYANTFPSLMGFETVFLSFGNSGENMDKGTPFKQNQSLMIQHYLEGGGKLYVEMGGMFYKMNHESFTNRQVMKQLFGVSSFVMTDIENPVGTLVGVAGTPAEGMLFAGSDQMVNWHIDKLNPATSANTPFYEQDFGNVAILNDGSATYNHKTFYFGYSLAELRDRNALSSRYNVLLKTLEFFGYTFPPGYILSNFITDKTAGGPPLQVQFTDISISDPVYPVLSWQWDFDNDGTIDSDEQNPAWTYNEPGLYTVKLITSNGMKSDTLVMDDLINVNTGYLVYEGVADGIDYSGAFIRDFLLENAYAVTYRNILPESLDGFSAVFLSYGNSGSERTLLSDQMALTIREYLENGGYVYLEGGDVLGNDQSSNTSLLSLFGLMITTDGTGVNPINSLEGKPTAITHDLVFTGSSQASCESIDKYAQSSNGKIAFVENGYGTVAVQQSIADGRRTFCFSYALSRLTDGEFPNTREELLNRILNFFDIYTAVPEVENRQTSSFEIYPNPGNNVLTISNPKKIMIENITIYNLAGQKVLQGKPVNNTLDISKLLPGMYFIELATNHGNVRKKLMVE